MPRRLFLIAAFVVALFAVLLTFPKTRIPLLVIAGRSPECPWSNAMGAPEELERQIAFKDKMLAGSRKLQTDPQGFELWDTPRGEFWIPKGSHFVLPFNLAEQERDIYTLGDVRIKAGDTVLDCGANIGVYSRKALRDGAAKVIAIEPAPENIECLRRNFARDIEAGRLVVYPKGVWDKDEELTLHVDPENSAADSFVIERKGARDVIKLPLTTIDKLVAELNLTRVDFIKMDIEGAEVRAIRGGATTIAKYHPRLALSSYHVPTDPVEVPKAVRAAWNGYQQRCGVCALAGFLVRPDILFFF